MDKSIAKQKINGFSLTELIVTVGIIGLLSTVAFPNYIAQLCRSESAEAESTIGSIQAIIAAYVDETGAYPKNWDNLNSISAIMSDNGQMSGAFSKPLKLPSGNYEVSVTGPADDTDPPDTSYEISATRINGCPNTDIKACLDVSTGASDLKRGNGTTNAEEPNCN